MRTHAQPGRRATTLASTAGSMFPPEMTATTGPSPARR